MFSRRFLLAPRALWEKDKHKYKGQKPPTLFPLIRCDVEQDGEGLVEAGGGSGGSLMALWSAASDGGRRSGFSVGILKTDVKGNAKCVKMCHLSRHSVCLKVA